MVSVASRILHSTIVCAIVDVQTNEGGGDMQLLDCGGSLFTDEELECADASNEPEMKIESGMRSEEYHTSS